MTQIIGQKKGYHISLEGVDAAGKTEQAIILKQALEASGFVANVFRSPGTTRIGEKIREMVKDPTITNMCDQTELYLMNADRAQLVEERIKPALARGEIVICDRYVYSTIVYQGFGRNIDMNIVKATTQYAVGDTMPDLTFVLDVSLEESIKRKNNRNITDRFELEDAAYQKRIRDGFEWLKTMESTSDGKLLVIDANQSIEEVHNEIFRCAAYRISSLTEGSLQIEKKILTK
jgi:dTMP kinase